MSRTVPLSQATVILLPPTQHRGPLPLQYIKEAFNKDRDKLFTKACSDRTRGKGFTLKESQFRLDIRNTFFTVRVVRHWHRLPREAVAAPSLAVFKARLDGALSNLVGWKMSLLMAGGVGTRWSIRSLPTQTSL